jgi:hypothetical protein
MGKPENGPPSGQSVEQLLSSIRQAIEADGSAVPAAAEKAPPKISVKATVEPPRIEPQPQDETPSPTNVKSANRVTRGAVRVIFPPIRTGSVIHSRARQPT